MSLIALAKLKNKLLPKMIKINFGIDLSRKQIYLLEKSVDCLERTDLIKMIQVVRVLLQMKYQNSLRHVLFQLIF